MEVKRDCRVYYVLCPEGCKDHFILEDACAPKYQHTPPVSPCAAFCFLCGNGYKFEVQEPWRTGYASLSDVDKGWTLVQPASTPEG
jgi:hypothetical protein